MKSYLTRHSSLLISKLNLLLFLILLPGLSHIPVSGSIPLSQVMNHPSKKTQFVVFKFDDLTETNWKTWKTVTDIVISKNITAEIGLFVRSLTVGSQDYLVYVQSLVDDPRHFEIWMHGWTGEAKEFLETDYDLQLDHFYKARTTMLMKYDYILRDYGDHYWGGNKNTVKIVNEDPFIKGWIYYENRKKEIVYGLNQDKQVMPALNVYMETATGVVSYKKFHSDWIKFKADTLPYVVIQGHAWGYRSDSLRNEFTRIVDDLIARGVTFTHFNDYNRMIKGYSTDLTAPSVPTGLLITRPDNTHISLKWNASVDTESGIDCYKIYRDGICIDLSATTTYTDVVTGSHSYEVAAVNRNDLVSARSVNTTSP